MINTWEDQIKKLRKEMTDIEKHIYKNSKLNNGYRTFYSYKKNNNFTKREILDIDPEDFINDILIEYCVFEKATYNALAHNGINKIGDILNLTFNDLESRRNISKCKLANILETITHVRLIISMIQDEMEGKK